jgi:ornithine--oxo-acid transaminase
MNAVSPPPGIRERIEDYITSSAHLSKKHVHPKLAKLLDMGGFSAVFTRAEGPYLWDTSGTRYLDFLAGGGVFFIGRNHPMVQRNLEAVLTRDAPSLTGYEPSRLGGLLANRLNALAGGAYPHTVFANSGTEATDVAVRLSRLITGRSRFLYVEGSFHGRSCAAISLVGWPQLKDGQDPLAIVTTPVRANDFEALRREIGHGDVAGFIFEPVQGMTTVPLDFEWLREAERLCQKHGTMMISDEVQTGLGRTGSWFRARAAGTTPDLITVSKTLSGGAMPISAVLVSEHVWQRAKAKNIPFPSFDEPYAENDLAMAAGLATLDALAAIDAPTESIRKGRLIREGLEKLASKHDVVDHVQGDGLMISLWFRDSAKPLLWAQQQILAMGDKTAFSASMNVDLFKNGKTLVQVPGPGLNAIKVLPPIVSSDQDIADFLDAVDASLGRAYGRQGPAVGLAMGAINSFTKQFRSQIPAAWVPPILKPKEATAEAAAPRLDVARIYEYDDYKGPMTERCDVVVVGSGPGGALVARELARAGKRVVVVEAGPVPRTESLTQDTGKALAKWYWEGGTRTSFGNVVMPTMQARCLGGGSVFNSMICLRASKTALEKWKDEAGLEGLSYDELAPHYEAVERFMGVKPTDEAVQGRRNELFAQACEKLGWHNAPIERNEDGCKGAGNCLLGCPNGAKLSTDRRGIPEVVAAGGRVYTSIAIDRVLFRDGKAVGVEGRVSHPDSQARTHAVTIHAKCVVLAAGAIHTPVLLRDSGLTRDVFGGNLRFHPSGFHMGVFDEPVRPWNGATQGYHSLEHIEHGIKLEALWASPSILAVRFPGSGRTLQKQMADYENVATWATWVSGDSSSGTVRSLNGRPRISYTLAEGDVRRLQEANALLAEMLFAAGAKKVITGLNGIPSELNDPSEVALIRNQNFSASDFPTGSNHVFGTAAMGKDPATSATDSWGKVHDVSDLYVADGSLLPSSPGANPMLTIMALAHRIGGELARRYA